ncbi:MAG: pyrroline-5-carboxylate reductase [Alphaproteobacteria bacterium]|nr:pyrroline-5-carboxylate reductase [Alphaproteobacteria bacterium]
MTTSVLLLGCGKMGGAMLGGWLDRGLDPARVWVVEPSSASREALRGVTAVASIGELPASARPDVVVLAIKPQSVDSVLPETLPYAGRAVFLSIIAGRTLRWFQDRLGPGAAIVRSMPNTPASVRRGMTVACAGPGVSEDQRLHCADLLQAVGEVAWIEDEALMDAVTAVSGSGPAYVFLLTEALAAAGVAAGLPADLAERLARATVTGSGELLRLASEPPADLRRNVTSPGGTTAAALSVLMDQDGLGPLMERAIAAATARSRELAG